MCGWSSSRAVGNGGRVLDPPLRAERSNDIIRGVPLIRSSVRTGPPSPRGRLSGDPKGRPYGLHPDLAAGASPRPTKFPHQKRLLGQARRSCGTALAFNFWTARAQWPGGNSDTHSDLRAGNVLPTPRDNPRKWGPGKGDYEHEVLIWSRPRRSFGFFPIVGKETRPAGRNSPAYNKCSPKPAPSSGPFGATFPYPLCRFATSPLDKGSRPPGGRLKKRRRNPP